MKFKIIAIMFVSCMLLCSCESVVQDSSTTSQADVEITTTSTTSEPTIVTIPPMSAATTLNDVHISEEEVKEILIPTSFSEDEKWLHSFIELNFDGAFRFVDLENIGADVEVEVCFVGDDRVGFYGRINDFANAEEYCASLSEYYSTDIVKVFMDRVTIAKKVKETDERYLKNEQISGRIYIETVDGQKYDENGDPVTQFTKYIEIDGVMYKDEGMASRGTDGVFEYAKIVSMTDDEIIFTYPVKQDNTDEFILIGVAEGRLVKENGKWKFGWHLSYDNYTDEYNDIWYT